jgi:penicillin-binding protein 1A
MMRALRVGPAVAPEPVAVPETGNEEGFDPLGIDELRLPEGEVEGLGLNLRVGPDGSIQINRARDRAPDREDRPRREDRAPRDDEPVDDF